MFQALEGALLIKIPIFKQMLFPISSCKFYSRVLTIFYARVYSCQLASLGCGEEALKACRARLLTQAAPQGCSAAPTWPPHCRMLQLSVPFFLVEGTDMHPESFQKCHAIANSVFEKSVDSKLCVKLLYFASNIVLQRFRDCSFAFHLTVYLKMQLQQTVTPPSLHANIFMSEYSKILLKIIFMFL